MDLATLVERLLQPEMLRRRFRHMKIYLSGPIAGCTDAECMDWRNDLKRWFAHHEFLDPMSRDNRGRDIWEIFQEIVDADKADIDNSDLVIAYVPFPSVGTSMEIMYARERGTPVYIIAPNKEKISPWHLAHATMLYDSFKSLQL